MKRIIWLFCYLIPFLAMGQTIDPGDIARDSVIAARRHSDSSHHTDTAHFHYNYAGTGTLNNTNYLKSFVFSNALKLSLLEKSSAISFTNSYVYGKENGLVTNNDFTSSLDIGVYETLKHFYYWGMANYTSSVSLLIHEQAQIGLGPGYNIIDKKTAVLVVSEGAIYEKGNLYDSLYGTPGGDIYQHDVYHEFRNSFHLMFHWVIRGKYTFDGSGFMQNNFTDFSDYKLQVNGTVSIKLQKWLSLTAAAAYNEFTRTRSRNTLVTFGLTVQR